MAARGASTGPTLGFLTIVDGSQFGAIGGFLVLNAAGRPLEFHCTTPVKPNRAQEILYGPTLRPYLYGEQIGPALVAKAAATLDLLCVDQLEALSIRPQIGSATVLVESASAMVAADASTGWHAQNMDVMGVEAPLPPCPHLPRPSHPCSERATPAVLQIDGPHAHARRPHWFDAGRRRLAVHHEFLSDCELAAARLEALTDFDLSEPFGRIREAIEEAQRGGR